MEGSINPEEQQAMAEWRNSQAEQPESASVQPPEPVSEMSGSDAIDGQQEDAATPPNTVNAQSESLSTVSQALEDAQQQLNTAMETGDQVSQQAAEKFTVENAIQAGKNFIDSLKARVTEALQQEKEGAEYNLVLAKELAKDAGQKLKEKFDKYDKSAVFAALAFGAMSLTMGTMMYLKAESLTPYQGTIFDGIKQYIDSVDAVHQPLAVVFPMMTSMFGAGAAMYAKASAEMGRKHSEKANNS